MSGIAGNALVTGGSRGIGRSCALSLARAGADVALTYVANQEAAEATAAEIRALGRRAVTIRGDVGVAEDNVATVEKVISELGPLRYLVANAANGTFGLADELSVEDWDYTMAAHVRSLLVLAQLATPSMTENGGGAIVAISSLGAHRVFDAYTAFGTAAGQRPRPRRDRRPRHLPPLRRGADGDRADALRRRRLHPPWLKGIHGLHRAE
jgi:enoyl-[acyl-carrier protein] reductase III